MTTYNNFLKQSSENNDFSTWKIDRHLEKFKDLDIFFSIKWVDDIIKKYFFNQKQYIDFNEFKNTLKIWILDYISTFDENLDFEELILKQEKIQDFVDLYRDLIYYWETTSHEWEKSIVKKQLNLSPKVQKATKSVSSFVSNILKFPKSKKF